MKTDAANSKFNWDYREITMLSSFVRNIGSAVLIVSAMGAFAAHADDFKLDYGNVAASDKQITITRLPIVNSNGKIIYKDVIIKFKLDSKRRLYVQKKYPKTSNSADLQSAKLVSSKYLLEGTNNVFDLVGPGVGPSGREVWSLIRLKSGDTAELTFYSGPVKRHPLQERINDAGVTSSPYTFGVSAENGSLNTYFNPNCLVSAHMNSGYLKLNSHSNSTYCDTDHANPTNTLTFEMCTPQDDCD